MMENALPPYATRGQAVTSAKVVLRPSDDCTVASWRVKWGAKKFLQDLPSTPKSLETKWFRVRFCRLNFAVEAEIETGGRGKLVSRIRQVNAFAYTVGCFALQQRAALELRSRGTCRLHDLLEFSTHTVRGSRTIQFHEHRTTLSGLIRTDHRRT